MQRKPLPKFRSLREAVDAGIAEADRREAITTGADGKRVAGQFDGLLGVLDPDSEEAVLLRDILAYLRDYLLDRYPDHEARRLLAEYEPRPGYRNMTPVDDDVALAIDLLNMFRSAMRTSETKHRGWPTMSELLFGKAGVTGKKVREPHKEANAGRSRVAAGQREAWQRRAAELWAMPQHEHKSASDIARLIDAARADYIRHYLRRPEK